MRTCLLGTTAALTAVSLLAACSHDSTPQSCVNLTLPGIVIYLPGIDLLVRDADGRGEALGTRAVVYRGTDSIVTTGHDTLLVNAGFSTAGTFAVRIDRPFYRDTVISNVTVADGRCAVVTTELPVTLQLVAGAPKIRSIAVLGVDFLYSPGLQRQLQARFDADPTVPTTVTWRISDSTLATISATGVVTAKCSVVGGTEIVTAIATADTSAKATSQFGVGKQASCP